MKVYISGKIGEEVISEATRQKFARAEEMLKAKGYEVFNPCDERWQKTLKREYEGDSYVKSPWLAGKFPDFYAYVLLRDLMVLSTKDAVFFLHDWKYSPGARSEYYFAVATKKTVFFADRGDAHDYLSTEFWRLADKGTLAQKYFDMASGTEALDAYVEDYSSDVWLPLE